MSCVFEPTFAAQTVAVFTTNSNAHVVGLIYMHSKLATYLWSPYGIGHAIIFFALWFLHLSSFFFLSFFSSPNLSRRRLDVCHTSTHGVALVRISDAGLKRAACGSLKIQDTIKSPKIAIWAPSHNFVRLYLCN